MYRKQDNAPSVTVKCDVPMMRHFFPVIRINPRDYDVPEGQIALPFGAADGIRKICGCV